MQTFKDRKGREWAIDVNLASIKRVHDLAGVRLTDLTGGADLRQWLVTRLEDDPVLLFNVLWALVKPQVEAQGIEPEDFGEAMAGDPIDAAVQAICRDVVLFTGSPRDRARMTRGLESWATLKETVRDLMEDPERAKTIEAKLRGSLSTLSDGPTSLPESAESTPDRARSAS